MANEFIIKNGYVSKGDSQVSGSLNVGTTATEHKLTITGKTYPSLEFLANATYQGVITSTTSTVASANSNGLTLQPGNNTAANGGGGNLTLGGGNSSNASGLKGGDVRIIGGYSGNSSRNIGEVFISGSLIDIKGPVEGSEFSGSFSGSFTGAIGGSETTVTAKEIIAGTGTTTIDDSIHTTGAITASGEISSSSTITGNSFVKGGGTSAQFLKADGSVDSSTYSTATGVENNADVTDTTNVTAAGALMDSEVDADIKTLTLPAETTISTFGKSLVDDADAETARTTLGLGTAAVAATGISNTNVPVFTSGVVDDDFLRVSGTSIEGLSASEVRSAIGAGTGDGTLTGNGTSTRVPFYNGTTSFTTNAAFVYTDASKRLDLTGIASSGNSPLRLANLQEDDTDSSKALILATDDDIMYRELGTNAFTSTTIPTNNNQLTNGAGYVTGAFPFTGSANISGSSEIIGSGSAIFQVEGSVGTLFSVDDGLDDVIFAANNVSGTPVISANADNTVKLGKLGGFGIVISGSTPAPNDSQAKIIITGSIHTSGSLGVGMAASSTTGRIDAKNDVVAFSTSDERLKDNVTPIEDALSKVSQVQGIEFDWIPKEGVHGNEGRDVGVIAQEIEKVLPEVVTTRDNGYKAVKYEKIIPLLVEAIKELQAEVQELKKDK